MGSYRLSFADCFSFLASARSITYIKDANGNSPLAVVGMGINRSRFFLHRLDF